MNDIFSDMQAVASDLLNEFSTGSVEYVSMAAGSGPVESPGAPTPTYTAINAIPRGVSSKFVDGSSIVASDLQLTMPADGITPEMTGFIRLGGSGGQRYKIVQINRVPPAGTPVVYIVIFRK